MASVAEQLRAEGFAQGFWEGFREGFRETFEEGIWIGKIQILEEFLDLPVTSREILNLLSLQELEGMHVRLRAEYETRFKRS